MKKIKHFLLPEHTNRLYIDEASSSIALTKDVADKINEIVDALNEFSSIDLEWKQTQEGTIRKAITYIKDNLLNTLHDLVELYEKEGYIDSYVKKYTEELEERLENILSNAAADGELLDVRYGSDGYTYKTAGESVRTQFKELLNLILERFDFIVERAGVSLITSWDAIVENTTINPSTGKIETLNGYHLYNDFIKVDATQKHYIFSPRYPISAYIYCYNRDKIYVGSIYTNISEIDSFPADTRFIKASFITDINPSNYGITLIEGSPSSKTVIKMHDTIIEPKHCSFFISDIFPKENYVKGYAIASDSGAFVKFTDRTYTDFINVSNVNYITSNFPFYISYYNELFEFMPDIKDIAYHRAGTIAIPESAYYCRLTLITEDDAVISTFTLSNGEYPAQDEPFINPSLQPQAAFNTWYKSKKVVAFGDSITELNQWQPYINAYFGCNMVNCGVGSSTVANNGLLKTVNGVEIESWMCSDDRINLIPADCDVILLFGGANDSTSIAIGDIKTDMDDSTFMGAYSLMIKKLINKFPKARLIALTPIAGRTDNVSSNQDKQFYINDLCMTDYADAVKTVCHYYSIPCIDVNGESGINVLNHTTYIQDIIHPNAEGGKRIANAVINGMKRFEPIAF